MSKVSFSYKWHLKDGFPANGVKPHNCSVFGTFICGGGSSMGYKLAGYNHLGGVEFTDHYSKLYAKNLAPKYLFVQDIREFNKREDLPKELYTLDLLDGSPPCAAFSTSGAREKVWGKKSKYENKVQIKDDLVFIYGDTILKLKPKVFLLENVSGLLKANAKSYVSRFVKQLSPDYNCQVFLLNAASMGVPQMRQRSFIIGLRKDFNLPKLVLKFNEKPISFIEATKEYWGEGGQSIEKYAIGALWDEIDYINGQRQHPKRFNLVRPALDRPCNTLVEQCILPNAASVVHPLQKRKLNKHESSVLQSYPLDYDFMDQNPLSAIGRSVPPVMMAHISYQIYIQWLKKLK